jgi:DNA-binding NarL/FixJ family response regulator
LIGFFILHYTLGDNMAKLVLFDPSYQVFLSDKNQAEGLPSCYENLAASPLPSAKLLKQLRAEILLLPKRQKQVIRFYLKGKTDKEIAKKLKIQRRTVNQYRLKAITILKIKLCKSWHS